MLLGLISGLPRGHSYFVTLHPRAPSRLLRACCVIALFGSAHQSESKLGDGLSTLTKRFGKQHAVTRLSEGDFYRFRSENFSADVLMRNGVSVAETYYSDQPLTAAGDPPVDTVRAILNKNAPKNRWIELRNADFDADYAVQSADGKYVATVSYTGSFPSGTVWVLIVLRTESAGGRATTALTQKLLKFARLPDDEQVPPDSATTTASPTTVALASQTPPPAASALQPPPPAPATPPRSPGKLIASGTGFFVSPDGYLLTNFHVIRAARRVTVITEEQPYDAKIVATDRGNDLAVLKVPTTSAPLALGDVQRVNLGDSVLTIGFPNIGVQGLAPKLTRGEISSLSGLQDDPRFFQISVPVQPGNSGGALVDEHGNVIGITSGQLSAIEMLKAAGSLPQNVNYAVKISYARLLLDNIPAARQSLPPPMSELLSPSAVVERARRAAALILVWGDR